jgi:S-(hydroxymethyl)glutathione dehydrogenase/alcohol dehydrogenase
MTLLPTKTIAAILVEQKKKLVIAEIDLPKKLDVGQTLVKIYYSGICGSQIGEIDGVKGIDKWLPHLLGHEGSGKVLAIGPGVKFVNPNDKVVLHWKASKGIESSNPIYHWNGIKVNAGLVTTFNQYAIVSENRLTKIDKDVDLKTAALYGCSITTGFGVIDNKAQLRLGENIVVFGAGGVGLNIIQAAVLAGANKIIAVDMYDHRLSLAKYCGATSIINTNKENACQLIIEIMKNETLDVFIDNTGNPEIISAGYKLVGEKGRVILVGVPKIGQLTSFDTLPLHFGKSITGTHGGEAFPDKDIPRYMTLINNRGINLDSLISEVNPLKKINEMVGRMRIGESTGRCLIKF